MGNFIIGKLLRWLGGRLDGYRTNIAGIGMILTGVAGLVGYMFPDIEGLPKMDVDAALMSISGGFGLIGIGGKLEKGKRATADEMAALRTQVQAMVERKTASEPYFGPMHDGH
jgi:hypothetical protein